MTETRPLGDVQAAYDRMLSGDARFRMVLTTGKRSHVKIAGQKRPGLGRGKRYGGHFPCSGTKRHLNQAALRDCGSKAAHCAAFDPQSPGDTLRGYQSSGKG